MEKIKIRGLVICSGWIFLTWGLIVSAKGFWDSFFGEPEANLYSPHKWEFITKSQWLNWAGFEIAYGIACLLLAYALLEYSKELPEYVERNNIVTKPQIPGSPELPK